MLMLVSLDGILDKCFINYRFSSKGRSYFKWNSIEFSVEFQMLENLLSLGRLIGWVGVPFFKRAMIPDALRVFGWVLRNRDSLKDMRQLSRVDPSSWGVTPMVGPM